MISCIVATDRNLCIGKNNDLPFRIPADLKRFKELTLDKNIVMGRRTWDSLPRKPLPNRNNIILSRSGEHFEGASSFTTIADIMECVENPMIIGGGEIYKLFAPYYDRIYMTTVDAIVDNGDTYFPDIDLNLYNITEQSYDESNGYFLTYTTYDKK